MPSEQFLKWGLSLIACYIAMRCLISLSEVLREHLKGLLIAHVKRQQIEMRKRQRIAELKEKIRAKKAAAESTTHVQIRKAA